MKKTTKKKVSKKKSSKTKKQGLVARLLSKLPSGLAPKLRVTAVILAFTASVFGVDQALRSAKSQGMLEGCVFAASAIMSELTGMSPSFFTEEMTETCKINLGM